MNLPSFVANFAMVLALRNLYTSVPDPVYNSLTDSTLESAVRYSVRKSSYSIGVYTLKIPKDVTNS